MKWINASKRLPESAKEVFVRNNGFMRVLFHENDGWFDPNEGCTYLMDSDDENNKIEWLDESEQPIKEVPVDKILCDFCGYAIPDHEERCIENGWVSKEEYDCAINEIGQLQEQLKDAESEIRELNNELRK